KGRRSSAQEAQLAPYDDDGLGPHDECASETPDLFWQTIGNLVGVGCRYQRPATRSQAARGNYSFPQAAKLVFVSGIDENESGNSMRILPGEMLHDQAAERMSHQHIRGRHAAVAAKVFRVPEDAFRIARHWTRVAPGVSGAIVGAGAREGCNLRLHERPVEGTAAEARIEHHRWRPRTLAIQMQPV